METSSAIYVAPCVLVALLFFWLPESPYWLIKIDEPERAKRSIAWYQPGTDSEKELQIIKNLVASANAQSFNEKLKKFKSRPVIKATILIIILFTFMQLTGLNSIVFYMEHILTESKSTLIDPSIVVIYVNTSALFAAAMSVCLIDRYGRRFLLIVSSAGVAISMAGLASNACLISHNADMEKLQWLPIFSLFMFMISYFAGLMSVPSAVLSEVFPSDIKCLAGCLASLVGALWSFAATKSFIPLIDIFGETFVFSAHGFFALLLILYVCIWMPETKGKNLQEIQNKLSRI